MLPVNYMVSYTATTQYIFKNKFSLMTQSFFLCFNINLTQLLPLPHSSTLWSPLSLFPPSLPPLTPACYLHHPLLHAALTHRRTPLLICRRRPQPTPTPVSVFTLTSCLYKITECLLHRQTKPLIFLFPLFLSGLISPGVSVPVQVPGTEQQGMSHNLGQYWARLQ